MRDLSKRLLDFAINVIRLLRKLPNTQEYKVIKYQLIKSEALMKQFDIDLLDHYNTAINLFHHNMPRLSVDIDLLCTTKKTPSYRRNLKIF